MLRKTQEAMRQDEFHRIQVVNYQSSTHYLNDNIQKTFEIINQMKNYSSNNLKSKEIYKEITLSQDQNSAQDIILIRPGKQSLKRSMKRFLKKRTMRIMIMPNLLNIGQIIIDLLPFQQDCIEKQTSNVVLINNLLVYAESFAIQKEEAEQQQIERQKQKQKWLTNIKNTIGHLSVPQNYLSAKKISKVTVFTVSEKAFTFFKRQKELLRTKKMNNSNIYEEQSQLNVKEFSFSKQKTQELQDFNELISLEKGQIDLLYQLSKTGFNDNDNYQKQHHQFVNIIEKYCELQNIKEQYFRSQLYFNNQKEQYENHYQKKQNLIRQTLKDQVLYLHQSQYHQKSRKQTEQCRQLQVEYIQNSFEFIQYYRSGQYKQLRNDHLNIEYIRQQLICPKKLKTTVIQIQLFNQQISIGFTQAQRNTLLNLIKQKKLAQIQALMAFIICKQYHFFNQNTLLSSKLSQNNKSKFQEVVKENHLAQYFYSSQTQSRRQIKSFKQMVPGIHVNYSKIFNESKLLGGGCGFSKIDLAHLQNMKEDDQQKLKSDKFFDENKYADESQFGDFIEIYNKYYTNNEINHEVLENRIRTIVEALHKQCEHIFSLAIRSKVIEFINLLINYYMIAIQKNDTQTIQKFIDKTDQELKDLKETCFQNRKKYPCLDLCQYFELLICLNQQRQGIDKLNQNQAFKIAEIILKLVKFGAGFTSIFGAIDTLSKIQLEDIQKQFKEIKQICLKLFESSQQVGQQALEQYTSYSIGSLSSKIQAIWLRKIQSLGDELGDEHLQIIFYLKEINEIQNKGNNEIVLFVYMQLNYLLQKKQKDDNLDSFTKLLKDTQQENLIFDFINYLQFKTYSTTLFESAKKLLDSMVTSEQFRQLKISLLLKFSIILDNFNDKKQEYRKLMIHLCMTYLQENEISVKIVFKGNQQMKLFIQDIEKYSIEIVNESKESYQTMKTMIQNEEQLNKIANKMESKEDVALLLAKTYVQMWEASVKQRQEQNKIAHKDDVLLEVIQLYIKQKVTYLDGYSFFESLNNNNQDDQIKLDDALKLIIDKFLIPNFVQPKHKQLNSNKSVEKSCKILSILAEGGSGKSMILKKLEVELLKSDSEYIKDESAEYIPFIIKCNSLDIKHPSIEEYLLSQNLSQSEIELLKKSERNKLIMLDGYDEYTGDYFKVYQKLKINNWTNTLVIVTSRLERISVSDAKLYFNYYDEQGNQGSNDSFSILKLEKIKDSDVKEYLERYKEQQSKQPNYNLEQHNQFQQIIFQSKNRQLLELLKLPINLYLTTRMVADLDLKNKDTLTAFQEASDQIEIQEIFFQQQFNKLSEALIEQKLKIATDSISESKKQLINTFQSCYFEYFQSIAMFMFLQKGKKANFLSIKKSDIIFNLRNEVNIYLNQNKIKIEDVIQSMKSYIDSRVITRIQLQMKEEDTENQSTQNALNDETLEFEFRHKSLFEYFTARAMKYDFDLHRENIFNLNSSQLRDFNINKRIIMSSEKNASEQQILVKLYKLLKLEIDSPLFKGNYSIEDISKTNRYIQFLKKSSVSHYTQTSLIDVGSSNLLSALFISKFSFPNLIFKKCSFSQAYISKSSHKVVEFQDCNLQNAFLENQNLEYFESSNTKNATFTALQQKFNTDDSCSFNQVIFFKNNLVSITQTGFINIFEVLPNKSQSCKKLLSNQITLAPLNTIHLVETKNFFVVTAKKSIFEIDILSLEKVNSFTFSYAIVSLSINNSKYVVTLSNNQILYGDIENGFKPLDKNKIYSDYSLSKDDFIITSQNNQINIYNLSNLQIIKTNLDPTSILQTSAFSEDGNYIVIGSKDNTCKVWNVKNGFELINTIQGHSRQINFVAFSEDSRYLATGSSDKTTNIWNVEQGFKLIKTIQGHNRVAFSADGKYLATGSGDKTCKIFKVENGFEVINTIQGHTSSINSAAFSSNGKYLATGSRDNTCKIWNLEKGFELINTIQGHTDQIKSVAFSADGKYLATGSFDSTCKIWNVEKGFELINAILKHISSVNSIAFSANKKYLATGSSDTSCKIWSVEKGYKLINTIVEHNNWVNSVAFSQDGKYLATGSKDKTCKIWNVEKKFELINSIQGHTSSIQSIAFSSDGKYLATGSEDDNCKIWNVKKGFELINTIQGNILDVSFSADAKYLATGFSDKNCQIWNVEKGFEFINTIQGHKSWINQVAFSADGKYLSTSSEDGTCKIWNVERGFELIDKIQGHISSIKSVAFSADGKYLATGSFDNTCKIWDVEKGFELIDTLQGHIQSVTFSQDGKYLATGSSDKYFQIWNVEKVFQLVNTIQAHTSSIITVAFSADGKHLATGSWDQICKIWSVEKGFELTNTIEGHTGWIQQVAFSANGKYLATASSDKTCKIWNQKKGFELINTIQGHNSSIQSVTFSADGKYLATGSYDKTCKIWHVEKGFELINPIMVHSHTINSVAFSVDGKYLVTGLENNTCKIWNIEKEFELISTIQGHTDYINQVSFSANGKYLATCSKDNTCKIWNMQQGFEFLNKIQGHTQQILPVAFSSDGKYFRTSSENNSYEYWNAEKYFEKVTAFEIENSHIKSNNFDNQIIENDQNKLLKLIQTYNLFAQLFEI